MFYEFLKVIESALLGPFEKPIFAFFIMKPDQSQVGEGLARPSKAKKKKESAEQRQRKISTEDLLAQDSALIGANLKDFINEETFNNLPIQQQV